MDDGLVETVVRDLIWLRDEWDEYISEDSMRRGSGVLRRLTAESQMYVARRELKIEKSLMVEAPYVEPFIRGQNRRRVDFLAGGGGNYDGLIMAFAVGAHGSSIPSPKGEKEAQEYAEYDFTLQDYLSSVGIYMRGYSVSREGVIKYVANKLGGVHYDEEREDPELQLLDSYRDRLKVDMGDSNVDMVYFELLSIGQLVGNSRAADFLIRAAEKSDEVSL